MLADKHFTANRCTVDAWVCLQVGVVSDFDLMALDASGKSHGR
jgi:hypothetical protein